MAWGFCFLVVVVVAVVIEEPIQEDDSFSCRTSEYPLVRVLVSALSTSEYPLVRVRCFAREVVVWFWFCGPAALDGDGSET